MSNNIDHNKIDNLLQFILLEAGRDEDFKSRSLGEIHLIKYVYLADLKFAEENNGQTYTGLPWRFHHFGPWETSLWKQIDPALKKINAEKQELSSDKYGDFVRWQLSDDVLYEEKRKNLPLIIKVTLPKYIQKFCNYTPELLHFVYATYPMLKVAPEELLNFTPLSLPSFDNTQEVSPILTKRQQKKRKEALNRIHEKLKEHRLKNPPKKRVPPPIPPIYDEIFEEGVKVLDSLAGKQIEPSKGIISFSDDIWHSKSRFDIDAL